MTDENIHEQISALVAEEHELRSRVQHHDLAPDEETRRLAELEVALDQCWDLLRQRDARRAAGQDPDDAAVRPAETVERYLS